VHRAGHWIFDGTGSATATCSAPARPSWVTSATGARSPTATGCRIRPARTERRRPSRSSAHARRKHFTRETAPRPPKPGEPSELEYIASRVFGTREPRRWNASVTATRAGYVHERGGATVLTSGSTDWAHGLAQRDPQIEQITRNILTKLDRAAIRKLRQYRAVRGKAVSTGLSSSSC